VHRHVVLVDDGQILDRDCFADGLGVLSGPVSSEKHGEYDDQQQDAA